MWQLLKVLLMLTRGTCVRYLHNSRTTQPGLLFNYIITVKKLIVYWSVWNRHCLLCVADSGVPVVACFVRRCSTGGVYCRNRQADPTGSAWQLHPNWWSYGTHAVTQS